MIRNPGCLPEGWEPADLPKKHASIPRNPKIARNVDVHLSQRQKTFLDTSQPGKIYKTSDYAEITGVAVRQAQRKLSELLELGFLQRRGKGRATVYVRTDLSP